MGRAKGEREEEESYLRSIKKQQKAKRAGSTSNDVL
jgi:hypothetical protein